MITSKSESISSDADRLHYVKVRVLLQGTRLALLGASLSRGGVSVPPLLGHVTELRFQRGDQLGLPHLAPARNVVLPAVRAREGHASLERKCGQMVDSRRKAGAETEAAGRSLRQRTELSKRFQPQREAIVPAPQLSDGFLVLPSLNVMQLRQGQGGR
jgi:hypothetical protein